MTIRLYNTVAGELQNFTPINPENVRVYYCGPTVYDYVHIGNLRAFLTADILVRTLRTQYPVTFVRNITDIDDKIIDRAHENRESIRSLTNKTIALFHDDIQRMGLIPPDIEPRATDHVDGMIKLIEELIHNGHAYVLKDEDGKSVYFDTSTYENHGKMSKRDHMEGESYILKSEKRNTADFVLWKPSLAHQPYWDSPWGKGRPGWHTECVVMSRQYLGEHFDIHGGGQDLLFPHHENENAQASCSGHHHDMMANYWVHNSMLLVDGKKMSKSEKNFLTINEVLVTTHPEVLKMFLLSANYRTPINFTWDSIHLMKKHLDRFYKAIELRDKLTDINTLSPTALEYLYDDMDTPGLISYMHVLSNQAFNGDIDSANELYIIGRFLNIFNELNWFQSVDSNLSAYIESMIALRAEHKLNKRWQEADGIRGKLFENGIILEDSKDGTTWRTR